jgi:hypothetical protein
MQNRETRGALRVCPPIFGGMDSDRSTPSAFRNGGRPGRLPTLGRRLLWGLLILLFVALFTIAVTVYIVFRLSVPLGLSALILAVVTVCLLYTSPSPRDRQKSRMPSSA